MIRFPVSAIACLAVLMMGTSALAQTGSSGSGTGSSGGTPGTGLGNGPPATPPPGTNSLGTAQSSGAGRGGNSAAPFKDDARDKTIDKKIKSICKGC